MNKDSKRGESDMAIWGKSGILGRENSKCEGPEVGACMGYLRNSKETSEGGEGWGMKSTG